MLAQPLVSFHLWPAGCVVAPEKEARWRRWMAWGWRTSTPAETEDKHTHQLNPEDIKDVNTFWLSQNTQDWNLSVNPTFSYPGVEAQQTDASRVNNISDRVGAGAVQVLLKFSKLDELSARQVVFESCPTHKVVLIAIPLMYPRRSGRVCARNKTRKILEKLKICPHSLRVYSRGTAMANFSGWTDRSLRRSSSCPLLVGPIRAMGRFRLVGWW